MPPPAILQQFGQIVPGAAKAILDDFLARAAGAAPAVAAGATAPTGGAEE